MEALKRATQLAPHILPERAAVLVLRALRVETDSWAQLSDILAERERTSPTSPRYSELQEQYFATRRDTKERLQTFEIPKELYDAAHKSIDSRKHRHLWVEPLNLWALGHIRDTLNRMKKNG